MQAFLGTIIMVGFTFAPEGWALCDGTLLPIAQNLALFSLLGVQFGGDGITTFALPDLRGCVPGGTGSSTSGLTYLPGKVQALAGSPGAESPSSGEPRVLGLNFIISTNGFYPTRN